MQSPINHQDSTDQALGEGRVITDLARCSIDLSWTRLVSDSTHCRSYPSPPMSGSPPPPLRRPLDFDEQGQGSFNGAPYDASRNARPALSESRSQQPRPQSMLFNREPPLSGPYGYQSREPAAVPVSYHPLRPPLQHQEPEPQQQAQQPAQPAAQAYPLPATAPIAMPQRPQSVEAAPYSSSPKAQRKTKGHVASACVPCKRAHLRCDAQRPCSRCLSNGKEESCVDMVHKKRGRPRLRDERESRYENLGAAFPPSQPEPSMGRPLSLYTPADAQNVGMSQMTRSNSFRTLATHGMQGPMGRYQDPASIGDGGYYTNQLPPTPQSASGHDIPCAFLNLDFQIIKTTSSFDEHIGMHAASRRLYDVVIPADRERLYRLQRDMEAERREREPNYLPPIFGRDDDERLIHSVLLSSEEIRRFCSERPQETWVFLTPDGHQRVLPVRVGLCRKESTFYVIIMLDLPVTPRSYRPTSSPYQQQHAFQTSQQPMNPLAVSPAYAQSYQQSYDSRSQTATYPQSPFSQGPSLVPNMPPIPQQPRSEYSAQRQDSTPRSEITVPLGIRQHELQLPPIRSHQNSNVGSRAPDRPGRVDIGGLLEQPGSNRKR